MQSVNEQRELIAFLEEYLGISSLGLQENLFDRGLNSMQVMMLLTFIEERFKRSIPQDQITTENLATVESVATLIRTQGQAI
jgi:acyl carrier protein